jgi:hypothetical protein
LLRHALCDQVICYGCAGQPVTRLSPGFSR